MENLAKYLLPCPTWRAFERRLGKLHDDESYAKANEVFASFCLLRLKMERDGEVYTWKEFPLHLRQEYNIPYLAAGADIIRCHADGTWRAVKCILRTHYNSNRSVSDPACNSHAIFLAKYMPSFGIDQVKGCFMTNGTKFPFIFETNPLYENYLHGYFEDLSNQQMDRTKRFLRREIEDFEEISDDDELGDVMDVDDIPLGTRWNPANTAALRNRELRNMAAAYRTNHHQ